MKKTILLFFIFLSLPLVAKAYFCPATPDGQHYYMYFTSPVHTASGHSYYKECQECGKTVHEYYRILSNCCLCVGHSMTWWSTPSLVHEELGHRTQRSCTRCGYVQISYVYDPSCCLCTGNHQYTYHVSPFHGSQGHENYRLCMGCGTRETTHYSTAPDCCLCGNHTFNTWGPMSPVHTSQGHQQERSCIRCPATESRHVSDPGCCQCTGMHQYQVTGISPVHTDAGHLRTETCITCGRTRMSYVVSVDCCGCMGHSHSAWSSPGIHTPSGHMRTRTCHRCGDVQSEFVTMEGCCGCHGHVYGSWSLPGTHTPQGHWQERSCSICLETQQRVIKDFNCPLCSDDPANSEEFILWLMHKGIPPLSYNGNYTACYETYVSHQLIVYGNPQQVPGNEFKEGEYRYHGYTYLEELFTNMLFPNDVESGIIPEEWVFIAVPGALSSWEGLEPTVQRAYMLDTLLWGHGATTLTAGGIGMENAKVQSAACWSGAGSIYTNKPGGFYATFIVPSMGMGTLNAQIQAIPQEVFFYPGEGQLETSLVLSASVNKPSNEIKSISVLFEGESKNPANTLSKASSITREKTVVLPRPEHFPGEMVFRGFVEVESIFGDKLMKEVNCVVILREILDAGNGENPGDPSPPIPPEVPPPPGNDEDGIGILSVSITGSVNHWRGQPLPGGSQRPDMPHRFLSLEKVSVDIRVSPTVRQIVIRFSPQLEAMQYTNSLGQTYDYALDFFGAYVFFPENSTLTVSGTGEYLDLNWTYFLPLCNETMDWSDQRIRPPYTMTVTAYGEESSVSHVIGDIDITGNIYDILHPQPIH